MKKKLKPLRVGFDLDGVILYNPARVIRPIVSFLKKRKLLIKRDELKFYYPKSPWEKMIWRLFHKSSIFQASGLDTLKQLVDEGKVEAYIVTARFGYLEEDFAEWLKKIQADTIFKKCYMNKGNQQPHLFKKKMLDILNLDVFVEDNWDIVNYLHKQGNTKAFWIYNIFDKKIQHPHKFPHLRKAVSEIEKMVHSV